MADDFIQEYLATKHRRCVSGSWWGCCIFDTPPACLESAAGLDKCGQREAYSERHCCHAEYRPDTKWEAVVLVREQGASESGFGAGSAVGEAVQFADQSCQISVYDGCDINYYL